MNLDREEGAFQRVGEGKERARLPTGVMRVSWNQIQRRGWALRNQPYGSGRSLMSYGSVFQVGPHSTSSDLTVNCDSRVTGVCLSTPRTGQTLNHPETTHWEHTELARGSKESIQNTQSNSPRG